MSDDATPILRRWLSATAGIAAAVNRPVPLPALLDLVSRTAAELMDFDFCAVLLPGPQQDVLLIEGSYGLSEDYLRQVNEHNPVTLLGPRGGDDPASPSGRAFRSGVAAHVRDTLADRAFLPWGGVAREQGYRSMISVPLLVSGRSLGTLNCYRRAPGGFEEEQVELLSMLADQAGVAITSARQQQLDRQGAEIHAQLTDVALRGGGVTGVAEALAGLLGRSVRIAEEPEAGEDPPTAATGGSETAVRLGSEVVARIWTDAPSEQLTALERRALEQAATVCALELLRSRAALEAEWRVSGELLSDLLTGGATARVHERARRLDHDLGRAHVVVVVGCRRATTDERRRVLSVARGVALSAHPRSLLTTVGDDVVLLWAAGEAEVRPRAEALHRSLVRACPQVAPVVALSAPCHGLGDYPPALRRARGAVALQALHPPDARGGVVALDDLGAAGLLLQVDDVGELARFVEARLRPLREHDAQRGGALEATVRAYLRHDLSTARTAAALFVHPNTVGLRVRRAEQLLGYSLTEVGSLAELVLAVRADEVLSARR